MGDNVSTFLNEAPDKDYLLIKVAAIMDIAGDCRTAELVDMQIGHIDRDSVFVVNIPDTKPKRPRVFGVVDVESNNTRYLQVYRFFINYKRNKCTVQAVGKNTLSKFLKPISAFLQLPDSALYTGHCFRRFSASFLVDGGGDLPTLKNHGEWKSSTVAEGFYKNPFSHLKTSITRLETIRL